MGKEGESGTCGQATKGIVGRGAGAPHKGKSRGKEEKAEKSREGRGGAPCRGKSAVRRLEEELMGKFEEEG